MVCVRVHAPSEPNPYTPACLLLPDVSMSAPGLPTLWIGDGETATFLFRHLLMSAVKHKHKQMSHITSPTYIYSPGHENQSDQGEQRKKKKNKQLSNFHFFHLILIPWDSRQLCQGYFVTQIKQPDVASND